MPNTTAAIYAILNRSTVEYRKILSTLLSESDPLAAYHRVAGTLDTLQLYYALNDYLMQHPRRVRSPAFPALYFAVSRRSIPQRYRTPPDPAPPTPAKTPSDP